VIVPPVPPFRGGLLEKGEATLLPRYEDVTQDGRLVLTAMMPGLGAAVWRSLLNANPVLDRFREEGIIPILRRVAIVADEGRGPVSVHEPVHYEGTVRLARESGGDRIFLNMWLDAYAPEASTFGPPAAKDAARARVGRVFAEHVVTRPFAPPAERKVTRLDAPGIAAVPDDEHAFEPAEALLEGATLEDVGAVVFGMIHTDSNQHVNSLVYPRLFEEALLRVVGSEAKGLVARRVEMRWRKPFFTGDRARVLLRIEEKSERVVRAVGAFVAEGGDPAKPHATVAIALG
jgi:hypothetical protein